MPVYLNFDLAQSSENSPHFQSFMKDFPLGVPKTAGQHGNTVWENTNY